MNLRKLYYLLSPKARLIARRLYYWPVDAIDDLLGRRDKMTPPKGMVFVGHGDFKKAGIDLLKQIERTCLISPDMNVLDIGCGIGRLAVPLTGFLSPKGKYEGFDIVKQGISWCTKHISSQYPNFKFLHIDLRNELYNLDVDREANSFVFPYEAESFDLVVLTSVFTHMMPKDVDNYLKNIHRVLKPNGKCFATFFLINDDIEKRLSNRTEFNFPYDFGTYRLMDEKVKEANIAFSESHLLENLIGGYNFNIDSVNYGWWSGLPREQSLNYQDVIIVSKR